MMYFEFARGVKREERHIEYVGYKAIPMLDKAIWNWNSYTQMGDGSFLIYFCVLLFCD